jgi:hypothetical protein
VEYSSPNKEVAELPKVSYMRLKGEDAQEHARKCRDYIDGMALYEHPYQVRRYSRWRRADLFKQAIQWLRKSFNSDPVVSMHFAPLEFRSENDPDYIPTPVFDEFSAPINNEAARLGRPEYKPYVRPRGERPDVTTRTGARLGTDVLHSMLRDMRWPEQEELGYTHMPLYGGWWLESSWDSSWEKTTKIPVQGAMKCPQCDFRVASPEISEEQAIPHLQNDSVKPKVGGTEDKPTFSYEVTECLTCEPKTENRVSVLEGPNGPEPTMEETVTPVPPLEPFVPVDQELNEQDFFQRPLGEDVPEGQWKCETGSPYDYFLTNLGIDQSPADMTEWVSIKVRHLDYFRNRWENAHLIKAEKPEALMKYHPVAGERAMYFGSGLYGVKLFSSHARLKQYHKKPWREPVYGPNGECTGLKMNRGRSIVMGGDVLLFDGDYLMESKNNPGTFIPRVHLDYAAFEHRSGGREFDGMSMSERLFDACENGNEILSQMQDARVQEGSPKWLETRGMNTDYEAGGGAGSRWLYDPDPQAPGDKPQRIGNELMNPAVFQELSHIIAFISRASSMTETERGQPPTGITAALALQFLQEQSGEQRRPRIRAIREMLMRVFSHGLALCHELVREPRPYWTKEDRGNWSEKSWRGTDLVNQTDVQIDPEPDHDTDLQKQQRIMDFIKDIMRLIPDPKLARKVARKMHVDESLFQDDNLQEETAQREFCEWIDYEQEPVVDEDLDAHETHYDTHGVDVMNERFRDLEDEAGWDKFIPYVSGWKDQFNDQQMPVEIPQFTPAPGEIPPPPPPPQVIQGFDTLLKAKGFVSMEARIDKTWEVLAQKAGFVPDPGTEQALAKVRRFRAHMAAHKIIAEKQKQAAAMGAQVMAAPESPEQTMAGTIPTAGGSNSMVAA